MEKGEDIIIWKKGFEDDSSSSSSEQDSKFYTRRRNRASSHASSDTGSESSFPSIQTATFLPTANGEEGAPQDTEVSADQERQILLLMLLAQVCALHDPTPKTFTVHVLELFERGILDRESIHFLFELGLVPAIAPSRNLRTNGQALDNPDSPQNQLAIVTKPVLDTEELRVQEASSIRSRLAEQEQQDQMPRPSTNSTDSTPWEVEYFPLSLSRYQREFIQVAQLSAGSFGQVFHSRRKMDGCDYAIKKVSFDVTGYSTEMIQRVVREVECLATVNDHPNVVRYFSSWLEPSWMTGSGHSVESKVPQHKLLTDLQQLMQPSNEEQDTSKRGDSSYFTRDFSSSYPSRRRRFSFGSSVDSMGQTWGGNHDLNLSDLGRAYDDSCLMDRRETSPKQQPKKQSQTYRYQISLYIQMQLCHPATLADWIRERNRQIPEGDHVYRVGPALDIFKQLVSGLAHVHSKGIIHRDLKPANIFASEDGKLIKIGDFGLSKHLLGLRATPPASSPTKTASMQRDTSPPKSNETQTTTPHHQYWHDAKFNQHAIVPVRNHPQALMKYGKNILDPLTAGIGTLSYAAPEQVKSRAYGTSADIFSVGLILLELVSCFETEHERLHNFQLCRNQKLPAWIHGSYPEIATTILACTRVDPAQRPSAQALVDSIKRILMPRAYTELHLLKGELVAKEKELEEQKNELAEKDKIIEDMRIEMERMKADVISTRGERVVAEESTSFQDED